VLAPHPLRTAARADVAARHAACGAFRRIAAVLRAAARVPARQLVSPGGITVQALLVALLHRLELPAGPGPHAEPFRHVPYPVPGSITELHKTAGLPSVGASAQVPRTAWLQLPSVRTQPPPLVEHVLSGHLSQLRAGPAIRWWVRQVSPAASRSTSSGNKARAVTKRRHRRSILMVPTPHSRAA
jgi:hypothetical protein